MIKVNTAQLGSRSSDVLFLFTKPKRPLLLLEARLKLGEIIFLITHHSPSPAVKEKHNFDVIIEFVYYLEFFIYKF
jgi:hypothetical protein